MPEALVVNALPLIFLGNAGHLDLLRAVGAQRVLVPGEVFDEVTFRGTCGPGCKGTCRGELDRTGRRNGDPPFRAGMGSWYR